MEYVIVGVLVLVALGIWVAVARGGKKLERQQATKLEGALSASLRAAEELAAIRPDLDGGQIMAELGVAPGPVVGEAYRFLMDLRMEKGPIGEDLARQALRSWWAARQKS